MLPKPEWKNWLDLAEVKVEQAVALSCNVAPDYDKTKGLYTENDEPMRNEMARRLSIAKSQLRADKLAHTTKGSDFSGYSYWVGLQDFRSWGESLAAPFTFPDEFPRALPGSLLESDLPDELRAANEAFRAVQNDPQAIIKQTPKAALMDWLARNKPELSANARERVATVANWQPQGGAPKTPGN